MSPRNEIYTGSFRFNEGVPLKSQGKTKEDDDFAKKF